MNKARWTIPVLSLLIVISMLLVACAPAAKAPAASTGPIKIGGTLPLTGGYADTVIHLYDSADTLIAENDDADQGANWPASRLVWRASQSGDYYLFVQYYQDHEAGCATAYNLTIAEMRPAAFLPEVAQP